MEAARIPIDSQTSLLRHPEFGHGLRAALHLVREAHSPRPRPLPEPISPELALVCPELRQQALAALPDLDPEGFLPTGRLTGPTRESEQAPRPGGPRPRLAIAAAAYVAVEVAQVAVYGALVMGGLAGLITLATQIYGG